MLYELNLIESYILLLDDLYELDYKEKKYVNTILESVYHLRKIYEKKESYEKD